MDALIAHATDPLSGTLSLPADKAICHRAAILCALTIGSTQISPWSSAKDCQQTLEALRALGVPINDQPQGIRIEGVGLRGLQAPRVPLDCGESGTTMRLLCGLLAGQPFASTLIAGGSLRRRPMRRVVEPLVKMGVRVTATSPASAAGNLPEDHPPLNIVGARQLKAITHPLPVASAQVKSAILLAGLYADGPTTVIEPAATRDHTERFLSRLGVTLRRQGQTVTLEPPHEALTAPGRVAIPGDPSSAAFFIVAASVLPGSKLVIDDVGLNPTRTHFLEVLQRMGAAIRVERHDEAWEPRGTITVESRPLHGTDIPPSDVPALIDELPILMVAACAAEGQSRFAGLQELRVKETDRLQSMTTGLKRLGARIEPVGTDAMLMAKSRLHGSVVDSVHDHRTAMSLAIAGLVAAGETRIRAVECVAKSFGNFFELLASLAGAGRVTTV
jgi:3-phosphoshikimate 1-carboxyvinyltransferase